ncbi:hypothetical protein O3M35_012094 [Rhynocoris fuscipes]|uniref:Uncharacterized protein n=1 Tax=Rhynocoris fuscipes TaxID=488301 RepID=A0AAW1CR43_9HEMI
MLDPTVRYESNDESQAEVIAKEKYDIYIKCTGYLQEKFREKHGERRYKVRGFWFGFRGTVPQASYEFLSRFRCRCFSADAVGRGDHY